MEFIAKYWDRLVAVLLSTVIAGVIGFFSAVVSIKDQIGNLQMEVRNLNTLADKGRGGCESRGCARMSSFKSRRLAV